MTPEELTTFIKKLPPVVWKRVAAHSPLKEHLVVLARACTDNQVKTVIEVGTYLGFSGLFLAGAVDKLHTVDIKQQNIRDAKKLHDKAGITNIEYHLGDSLKITPALAEALSGKFQFAYVDGRHTYDYVIKEYEALEKHIDKNCGAIFFDDADMVYKGIKLLGMPRAMQEIGASIYPGIKRFGYKLFGDFKLDTTLAGVDNSRTSATQ